MKTKEQIIKMTRKLKDLANTCFDEDIRQRLVQQIYALQWVHNEYD